MDKRLILEILNTIEGLDLVIADGPAQQYWDWYDEEGLPDYHRLERDGSIYRAKDVHQLEQARDVLQRWVGAQTWELKRALEK